MERVVELEELGLYWSEVMVVGRLRSGGFADGAEGTVG